MPDPRREARPPSDLGWLKRRAATSVALLDSLPPKLRASLAQPSRRRQPVRAREFPADPPPRPPVMAEGATWPSGAVAPFPAVWFNTVAEAIVGAIPPDDACLADEDECFDRHPVHLGWSVDGTARTAYAKVDGLVEIVLAAVVPLIRAQVLREYADRWHYVDHSHWPMSTFGAAPTPYCACGKTWPEGGCTERRNLIADADTFHEPDEPVADVVAAFEAGEAGETRRPPGWCRWHQMVDCFGATPDCGEAQVEIGGGGDRG